MGENGPTGALRLLDTQLGGQISWLLALAALGFLVAFLQTRPRFRILDDRQRSLVLWGVWLLTTGAFFSVALFYHTYYLVMVAPAISALAGIGIVALWREYRKSGSRTWWVLPLGLLLTAGVQAHILTSYPAWGRWLTPAVVGSCVLAGICLIFFRVRPFRNVPAAVVSAALAVLALMAPATAFAAYTMQHTQTGAILRAGPSASGISGGPGGTGGPPGASSSGRTGGFGPPPGAASSGQGTIPPAPPGDVAGQPGSHSGPPLVERCTGPTERRRTGRRPGELDAHGVPGGPPGRREVSGCHAQLE